MKCTTVAVATAIVSAASAFAQSTQMMDQMMSNPHTQSPWTIGVGAALPLGVGGEVNYRISPKFSVSVGAYGASFSRSFEGEAEEITYSENTLKDGDVVPDGAFTGTQVVRINDKGERVIDMSPEVIAIAQANGVDLTKTPNFGKRNYDVDFKLNGFPLAFNYHPFEGSFHVTAGVIFNNINGTANRSETYDSVNAENMQQTYTDTINYKAEFSNKVMPYLGVGGMGRFGQSNWGYMWEVGVIFTGGLKTSVTASSGDPLEPFLAEDLAAEKADFEKSLPKLDVLPLVKLGLTYSF